MFEEIKNRIADLTQTKKDIQNLYLLSNDEVEQTGLSERNMQISMELSFLNKLLQYDVSGSLPSDELCRERGESFESKTYYNLGEGEYIGDFEIGAKWAVDNFLGNDR